MNGLLRRAYDAELSAATEASVKGDMATAFRHLERAHILSQRHTLQHVRVHWLMLTLGVSGRDGREVLGQLSRIIAAAVFSRIWVPVGNTGRAKVSAMKPMPVPDDLRRILTQEG
jgi:hypothetical protein